MPLADLHLETSYRKGRDDIAEKFYLPSMRQADSYDRAVAFFRSTVFTIAWPALREFVARGSTMRVLCSHVLASEDVDALEEGHGARVDEVLSQRYAEEVQSMIRDRVLGRPARLLAALVANGTLSFRIAILREAARKGVAGRIFHDKVGIFSDRAGDAVVFKGSMNETWNGLAGDGNLESIDVFTTWGGERETERVRDERGYFEELWDGRYPGVIVRDFPDVAKAELERVASKDWQTELEAALDEQRSRVVEGVDPFGRTLLPHQAAGLASWAANGRRGILEFATGSGKTFTAITAIRDALVDHGEVVLVVVPDRVLFAQWYEELVATTSDLGASILRVGAGHSEWTDSLRPWTTRSTNRRIVLATVQTASSPEFLKRVSPGSDKLLVVDEVHRAGSQKQRALLDETVFRGARLGLSATPRRAGDPVGTAALLDFFGGILEPAYSLYDAIRDRVLCPYFYHPQVVSLTKDEQEEWDELALQIKRLAARQGDNSNADLQERMKLLLIRRARVVKQAAGKLALATRVIAEHYRDGQRWLVYCDNVDQLEAVRTQLGAAGLRTLPFHSAMDPSREETLRWFSKKGGIVVAIKCLDEGVNIPAVGHALILASSKNPREYIQRRGRVLRKTETKVLAHIYDAIVVPDIATASGVSDPITSGELARAIRFAGGAENPACATDLKLIAIEMGIDQEMFEHAGIEVDDEEE